MVNGLFDIFVRSYLHYLMTIPHLLNFHIPTYARFGKDSPLSYGHGFEYSRTNNPTRAALEICVSDLEGATFAVAFSSGMAAVASCLHLLSPGDSIAAVADAYGGTLRMINTLACPTYGVSVDYCEFSTNVTESQEEAIERIARIFNSLPHKDSTKMVWIESPSNPLLKLVDIMATKAAIKQVFPSKEVLLVVDNTFMSPYFQLPLSLGADLCVEASTKFLNGHSDMTGGIVSGREQDSSVSLEARLRHIQNAAGAVPSPFDCYLCLRGIKTLGIRMERSAQNAMAVAKFLEVHEKVEKVIYPGLASHPNHELARRQSKGFGSMITFFIRGDYEAARVFLENVQLFTLAESLGAVESLIESPAIMTHASIPRSRRIELGLYDNLVRISVGIEDEADLVADLKQALGAIS